MDEREKLRKFRELDDAFADALKELEGSKPKPAAVSNELADAERLREQEREKQRIFEKRLKALMAEYAQPADSVSTLIRTLVKLGRI
ncbi:MULTISPECIES: hypothetical protein [unclassified Halomonas]|nr:MULTISPECIES: hypothetical protein [unclassified Halomonas]QJQ96533.1 hypothetical protein HIO72_15510 [Halomonas sp. PA5]